MDRAERSGASCGSAPPIRSSSVRPSSHQVEPGCRDAHGPGPGLAATLAGIRRESRLRATSTVIPASESSLSAPPTSICTARAQLPLALVRSLDRGTASRNAASTSMLVARALSPSMCRRSQRPAAQIGATACRSQSVTTYGVPLSLLLHRFDLAGRPHPGDASLERGVADTWDDALISVRVNGPAARARIRVELQPPAKALIAAFALRRRGSIGPIGQAQARPPTSSATISIPSPALVRTVTTAGGELATGRFRWRPARRGFLRRRARSSGRTSHLSWTSAKRCGPSLWARRIRVFSGFSKPTAPGCRHGPLPRWERWHRTPCAVGAHPFWSSSALRADPR